MSESSRRVRKFERMFPNADLFGDKLVSQNIQQTDCYTMLPLVQQIIQSRIKEFESIYHTYEANELKQALSTIERLIPPSNFEVSSGNIV